MDFNGDGNNDFLVGERAGYINYYERNTDGTLKAGIQIKANGSVIDLGDNSAPVVVDWNEDGLMDILTGDDTNFEIRLYLNSGTVSSYVFSSFSVIKAAGQNISFMRLVPQVVDLDGDGKKDLIVGNGLVQNSRLYFYKNIGTNDSPEFGQPDELKKVDNFIIDPFWDVKFCIGDYNMDGQWDILLSDYVDDSNPNSDKIQIYLGEGGTPILSSEMSINRESPVSFGTYTKGRLPVYINVLKPQTIQFYLFAINGQKVKSIEHKVHSSGEQRFLLNVNNLTTGVYLVKYDLENYTAAKKIHALQ